MPRTRHPHRVDRAVAERVRALRLSRGLTQSQLAGGDFTKGFISQIESGHTRLSLRAAQIVAGRLGVPMADVIGDTAPADRAEHAALLQAEHELALGSAEAALRLARELRASAAFRPRALRVHGRALLALDRSQDALPILREAQREFRARRQLDLAARTAFDMAIAHARLDEPEEALVSALECDRAIAAGEIVDQSLELQLRAFLASIHTRRGDASAADLQIERALKLAGDISSHEAQAMLYASLARTEQDRGNLDVAIAHWQRSLTELDALGREQGVAESWHNLAVAYIERGDRKNAQQALSRADDMARSLRHDKLRPWIQVSRARIALENGQVAEADTILRDVVKAAALTPRAHAEALFLAARVARARNAGTPLVHRAYDDAVRAATGQPAGLRAQILRDYAETLEAEGDLRGSIEKMHAALDLFRPARKQPARIAPRA